MNTNKEITKKYKNDDITVVWKPKLCIHAAECVKRLPEVYDPKSKPWIKIENASSDALKSQIDKCPSGALSYYNNNENNKEIMEAQIKVNAMENGPLLVDGSIEVTKPDGTVEIKEKTTAFCRCGASVNKPYCDGQHRKIDFEG
ncbi:MAG: (4Fe-4S)-binding protein [Aureibaculum sp.]|nr:(4Fe-4S)-binding protein [Aureibaculum sp.]